MRPLMEVVFIIIEPLVENETECPKSLLRLTTTVNTIPVSPSEYVRGFSQMNID